MERLRDAVSRLRGVFYRVVMGVRAGKRFRVGRGAQIPRGRLVAGNDVTILSSCWIDGRVELGDGVFLHRGVILRSFTGTIAVGDGTTMNPYCVIYGDGGVDIGRMVSLAPGVTMFAAEKAIDDTARLIKDQGSTGAGITVEDDVWIGANATILDGVRIARGAVVGAGAVVTHDVEPNAVVVGVPARVIGMRGAPRGSLSDASS